MALVKRKTKTSNVRDPVAKELRRLYRQKGNRLHASDVVDAARSPESPLHKKFCWDDTEAAREYRLIQARQLIATVMITIPHSSRRTQTVRAYHSLRSDQRGYRHLKDIVEAPDLLESLLSQFASDLERLRDRYDAIRKTSQARSVFEVIDEFVGKHKEKEAA